jgi:radical SAM protein with 4Fe4S-binding SPASM domain
MDFPKALQVEVTNRCNFNCLMCVRRVWKAKPTDLSLDLLKKISSSFNRLDRLILYGQGEPLTNPNFLQILKISRENLPRDGEIILSTNGSLLYPHIAEKIIMDVGVDSISFSIDTVDTVKLSSIREGFDPNVVKNFQYVAGMKGKATRDFKLGVEAVLMRWNLKDLPRLVEELAGSVDYILVSHAVPYTYNVFRELTYTTLSKVSIEIIKPSLSYGWNLIREASYRLLGVAYGVDMGVKALEIIGELWRKAEENGYWINLPLMLESMDNIEVIRDVEKCFHECRRIAYEYQIDLKLPNLYPDARARRCPYVDKNVAFIRADGKVTPCLEFTYPHPVYINMHLKEVKEVIFGDLRLEEMENIWNKNSYVKFRDTRRDFANKIPWCGDCPYSSMGCFFTKTNDMDCYTNEPGCSECIYSVNLAQCNI